MYEKFYPHFCGREDDVKQEMRIELIKVIRRVKNGEVKVSEKNFVITAIKYRCYKIATKYITEDRTKKYLEDIRLKDRGYEVGWEDLVPGSLTSYKDLFSEFTTLEDQYMVMIILGTRGYTRRKLRSILKVSWPYMTELEHRVKEKIRDNILSRTQEA